LVESVGRIFVAAGFAPEVRLAVSDWVAAVGPPGAVVPPENLHLTFRFLGDIDETAFDRLAGGLDQARFPGPFHIRLGGLGAFPNPKKATVLWVGFEEGVDELSAIHLQVAEVCEEAGVDADERPFRPHLTVSRIRPPADVRPLVDSTDPLGVRSTIDEIVVLRSHLGQGSPRYELIERFPL
jgi:RNA 2',3'-cyclic 3'-phosphodiesterase